MSPNSAIIFVIIFMIIIIIIIATIITIKLICNESEYRTKHYAVNQPTNQLTRNN